MQQALRSVVAGWALARAHRKLMPGQSTSAAGGPTFQPDTAKRLVWRGWAMFARLLYEAFS